LEESGVRFSSQLVTFFAVSLLMLAIIYASADELFAGRTFVTRAGELRDALVPVYSWSFTKETPLPAAPMKPALPMYAPAPFPPPPASASEYLLNDSDTFFCAKFRDRVQLFANRGPARSFGFESCDAQLPSR
jgi:hypothetical protein